jgi:UDP-MurNAc hydroxylase
MRITALGHAGLKVDAGGSTVLIDPWFAPEGAFQASWFPFPDNAGLLQEPSVTRPDAVVVTHEHLDHLDPWFIARLPAGVPVIVPRYPSPVLRAKLAAAGDRQVIEVAEWDEIEAAPGIRVFFVSEPPMNHDSAVVVRADRRTLLDLNDARIFPVQVREIRARVGGPIDVLTFQGAGASWFPICYEYPGERRAELSAQKRKAKCSYCSQIMRAVQPTVGIPFAGPPAFLDPALAHHNAEMDGGIFPDQQQVIDWLATSRRITETALLLPGDAWDADVAGRDLGAARDPDPAWKGFRFEDRVDYLADYAARRRPHVDAVLARHPEPAGDLWPDFAAYFERLSGLNDYFNGRIDMRVGFEIDGPGGGRWAVDFRPGREGVLRDASGCAYHYRFDSQWLPPLLAGEVPWEDFLLSLRFTARRDPDRYNDHLLGLLKFADAGALAAVERFETTLSNDDRIEITYEGCTYRVQRHCPHAGNDLLDTGEVLPGGILRCLAHHYDFDLATGACLTGVSEPLQVERVDGRAEPSSGG